MCRPEPQIWLYNGKLSRYPLHIDSPLRTVQYWFTMQNLLLVRYPKQDYEMEKKLINRHNEPDYTNWDYNIKRFFDLYGFSEVWLNGGVGNVNAFLRVLKQPMIDCYNTYKSPGHSLTHSFIHSVTLGEKTLCLANANGRQQRPAPIHARMLGNATEARDLKSYI